MAKHTLKIFWCSYRKILKVYLAIFSRLCMKELLTSNWNFLTGFRSTDTIELLTFHQFKVSKKTSLNLDHIKTANTNYGNRQCYIQPLTSFKFHFHYHIERIV